MLRGKLRSRWTASCLVEMFGTYILVLAGPASVVIVSTTLAAAERLVMVALVFGLAVATMIIVIGEMSGANINPAVSIASAMAGVLEWKMLVSYAGFQIMGGLLAGLTLNLLLGSLAPSTHLGSTMLAANVSPIEGIALEIIGTLLLATSALLAGSFIRTAPRRALLVGGTLSILILFIGPLTGASFNPARSLGPAVFSGYYENQSLYWIGPFTGAACAGLIFRRLGRRN